MENELVPASVHHGLRAVPGLRKGRSGIRETAPIGPVSNDRVDAVLPHVGRQVAAMIELQRLSGMRPGEVVRMRSVDLDRSGRAWLYRPERHKTEHHGKTRQILLGPKAQVVLSGWLKPDPVAYLFSPKEASEEVSANRRKNRKTRVQPSQEIRRKRCPKKVPGDRYSRDSYRRAIA